MKTWENGITSQGIHCSRYIASYMKSCSQLKTGFYWSEFRKWLRMIGLSEDEINHISFLADNGKMELETNAKMFLKHILDE